MISMTSKSLQKVSSMKWAYDVFISFRGLDTGKNFTDHLFAALHQKGITAFRDNEASDRETSMSPELLKAIEESSFYIIVFSANYASSIRCLDELVKIVECMETIGQTIFPVFYDVEPTDIRKQKGKFSKAFSEHEQTFMGNVERVTQWRAAMTKVANLSGWDLLDRNESEFIQDIVQKISVKLSQRFCIVSNELVGIHSHIREVESLLEMGRDGTRIIGIYGTQGIGKTTIAQAVYDRLSWHFEDSSFLANVKEVSERFGLVTLQKQLFSDILNEREIDIWNVEGGVAVIRRIMFYKRALVVIDDVDKLEQLESLVGNGDWFGEGSRIIVTTRDEKLLIRHGVERVYKVGRLTDDEALRLFCQKAFKKEKPEEEYVALSKQFVKYADGVPLALKRLGSFLFGRSVIEWTSALDRIHKFPDYWKSL